MIEQKSDNYVIFGLMSGLKEDEIAKTNPGLSKRQWDILLRNMEPRTLVQPHPDTLEEDVLNLAEKIKKDCGLLFGETPIPIIHKAAFKLPKGQGNYIQLDEKLNLIRVCEIAKDMPDDSTLVLPLSFGWHNICAVLSDINPKAKFHVKNAPEMIQMFASQHLTTRLTGVLAKILAQKNQPPAIVQSLNTESVAPAPVRETKKRGQNEMETDISDPITVNQNGAEGHRRVSQKTALLAHSLIRANNGLSVSSSAPTESPPALTTSSSNDDFVQLSPLTSLDSDDDNRASRTFSFIRNSSMR